jgi:hypothetical protein
MSITPSVSKPYLSLFIPLWCLEHAGVKQVAYYTTCGISYAIRPHWDSRD